MQKVVHSNPEFVKIHVIQCICYQICTEERDKRWYSIHSCRWVAYINYIYIRQLTTHGIMEICQMLSFRHTVRYIETMQDWEENAIPLSKNKESDRFFSFLRSLIVQSDKERIWIMIVFSRYSLSLRLE